MKIAIHKQKNDFSEKWIRYCNSAGIDYKIVNCYDDSIMDSLTDCDALMWHFHQSSRKDVLIAKPIVNALTSAGKIVFPDCNTSWHFDDKVGQKYLLESVNAPVVPSYVFYEYEQAKDWVKKTDFPKVFKLRTGAGSSNVQKVESRKKAYQLINRAFKNGFNQYNAVSNLKERWRLYKIGKTDLLNVLKGAVRIFYTTEFNRWAEKEKGYVYFQDYVSGNCYDIRIIVIDGKAFGIKRMNRENDFRASGSSKIDYSKSNISELTLKISFELANKLRTQSLAIDYVYKDGHPLISEISYGFSKEIYCQCPGYWDSDLNWYPGPFNPQEWMVDAVVKAVTKGELSSKKPPVHRPDYSAIV